MGRIEKTIFIIIFAIFLVLAVLIMKGFYSNEQSTSAYEVALIMDGTSEKYWRQLKMGVEKAALDYNVDLRLVGNYGGLTAEEQISLMEREMDNKVDAVIINPIDSEEVSRWIDDKKKTIPIISVGGRIDSSRVLAFASADNSAMGEKLAEAIAREHSNEKIYIFTYDQEELVIQERYEGLSLKLKELSIGFETIYLSNGTVNYGNVFLEDIEQGSFLIGLDTAITEQLIAAGDISDKIFGIGLSDIVISNLENGRISSLIIQSEYDVGYVSLMWISNVLNKEELKKTVLKVYEINKENMFTKPFEQIIFPIP